MEKPYQANFSGWWDKQSFEWQYSIQEEVNLATLKSLGRIALLAEIEDIKERRKLAYDISDNTGNAIVQAIRMGENRKKTLNGQAALFSNIALIFQCLGAALLIVGKYISIRSPKL